MADTERLTAENRHRFGYLAILIISYLILFFPGISSGEIIHKGRSLGMNFKVEQLVTGLGVPWGMAFIGPNKVLFTEQSGKLGILNTLDGRNSPVTGGPEVKFRGQGGLLDVAVPNEYSPNHWIYFTYSKPFENKAVTTLARARLRQNRLTDWQDLMVTRSATNTTRHFGSRITFDGKGHLFFSVGDRGFRPNGQDLMTHAGSILRLSTNGEVPSDNPFVDNPKALPEIWSFGHRNPQGLAFDFKRQVLWSIEHGPRGGDEINRILPGGNYGWATVSYGKEYWGPVQVGEGTEKEGMESPVKVYIPSIAPGSLLIYSGKAFPAWRENLLAGALKLTHLNIVKLDPNGRVIGEERILSELGERIRALVESPEGFIYFSTDSGKILRISPTETMFASLVTH